MNKNRTKNNFKFIVFILILCLVAFGGAMLLKDDDSVINDVINLLDSDNFIKDNYNGVYLYKESLGGSTNLFRGCTLEHIDYYIMIVNEEFYTYRSSCIGTFAFEQGKTKDLKIYSNEESKKFYIEYQDKVYTKDDSIRTITLENNVVKNENGFNVNNYQILFEQSQFPGAYFNVRNQKISSISTTMYINIVHEEGEKFKITINNKSNELIYEYTFENFKQMPYLYPYGSYLVILEKDESDTKYMHTIKVLGDYGLVYNLAEHFPITIDDVVLDQNTSIYATFDKYTRKFKVLLGNDKKMCVENGTTNDVTYYEFTVDYNYNIKGFDAPVFVKQGYAKDGCSYIEEVMGGN